MDDLTHELVAAYALDALDETERREFEEHLSQCEQCRHELASLREPVTALAFGAPAADPSSDLRRRILEQARSERPNVHPLRPRRLVAVGSLAAVASAAAVALGVWIAVGAGDAGPLRSIPLRGAAGSVVVAGNGGSGVLVLSRLPAAPAGKTYEAWVLAGQTAQPAGLFRGGGTVSLALSRAVPKGARIGVTVERAGGSERPTSAPFVLSEPV